MEDVDLDKLIEIARGMFNVGPKTQAVPTAVGTIQSPIKGTFYNSGNFSFQATDPRHPKGHMGVDMRASGGTSIYPMAPGVVTNVGIDPVGGNVVNISHVNGLRTYYAHMSSVKVQKGDKVDNDTVIGTVGDTGNAKGTIPHLHFQVWKDNQIQNPASYFSVPNYTNFNKNKEQVWLSEEAKEAAKSFNMKSHLAQNKAALHRKINQLTKIADIYLTITLS